MKKFLSVVMIIVVIGLVLLLTKDIVAQAVVENGCRIATGLKLKMDKLHISLSKTYVDVQGLKLFNPKGYADPVMVDMPQALVDFSIQDLMKGKLHLSRIVFNLQEINVVKNQNKELNIDALKPKQAPKQEAEKPKTEKKAGKPMSMQIDMLALKVGKVSYKDYSMSDKPLVQEFKINLDEEYKDIKNPAYLVSFILMRAMMNTPLAALSNLNLDNLQALGAGALGTSEKLATETIGKATESLGGVSDSLKETTGALSEQAKDLSSGLKGAASGVTDAAAELKNKLKLPFGKNE